MFDIGSDCCLQWWCCSILVTLPVELNASRRAIEAAYRRWDIIDSTEVKGARKVLSAAAMTYIAALATAVLQSNKDYY